MAALHLMTKTVWITRTRPSADESADMWRAAGFTPLVLPVLKVRAIESGTVPRDTVIIFTSKNGVAHFKGNGQRAICVGDATAKKARAAGYRNVVSVDGTSADVTTWVQQNLPKTHPICHVSGWHVRGSISEDLQASGFSASRLKTYRSFPIQAWPDQPVDLAAFYSPLAAQVFAQEAEGRDVSALTAVCISAATAQALEGLMLAGCVIAANPREDEQIAVAKTIPCD